MEIYDVPRQPHPYTSYTGTANNSPRYVNVGRTVEMELNSIAHEETTRLREMEEREREREREEEAAKRTTSIIERAKGLPLSKCLSWRALLVVMVVLSFLMSSVATILGAVAISYH